MGDQNVPYPEPVSAHSAESKIEKYILKIKETLQRGDLLGTVKPIWTKALESECRISWLQVMLDKGLVVRDVQALGRSTFDKLRTESSKEEDLGRETLIELMHVKLIDEKRYYRECKKIRETVRNFLRKELGRKKYDYLMKKIKEKIDS